MKIKAIKSVLASSDSPTSLVTFSHEYPPIPVRSHDWAAYLTAFFDPDNADPVGWGESPEVALSDLWEQVFDDYPKLSAEQSAALEAVLIQDMEKKYENPEGPVERAYVRGYRHCMSAIFGLLE